jgi:hypothetical protein
MGAVREAPEVEGKLSFMQVTLDFQRRLASGVTRIQIIVGGSGSMGE